MFRNPPPCTRNGQLSLVNMITELVEHRDRNKMLVNLVKKASSGTRQLLVLSDRRQHCEFLHKCFPTSSGLYMGGMKEADLEASSKKKIIFATFSQAPRRFGHSNIGHCHLSYTQVRHSTIYRTCYARDAREE